MMKDVDRPTNGEDKENKAMRKLKELPKPNALGYNADLSEIRPKFSGNLAKEKLVSSKSERIALKPVANSTNGQMRTAAKKRMSPYVYVATPTVQKDTTKKVLEVPPLQIVATQYVSGPATNMPISKKSMELDKCRQYITSQVEAQHKRDEADEKAETFGARKKDKNEKTLLGVYGKPIVSSPYGKYFKAKKRRASFKFTMDPLRNLKSPNKLTPRCAGYQNPKQNCQDGPKKAMRSISRRPSMKFTLDPLRKLNYLKPKYGKKQQENRSP
jgi:hypothetical protein